MIDPNYVVEAVTGAKSELYTHYKTLDILEGNLEPYILKCLEKQLSQRVMMYAKQRLVPINIFPRYVDKLTNIYQTGVVREVQDGDQSDSDLVGWYEKAMSVNKIMHQGNRLFNACKSCLVHPYATETGPKLRVIPNDRFIVCSFDPIEPTKPTMVILLAGKDSMDREVYWVYTDAQFLVIKSDRSIDYQAMAEMGVPDGLNPYGVLPFIYVNSSSLRLRPTPDTDSTAMAEFVPMALTDLNLAAMFSAFSITHITNGSVENLVYAPNALWFLKSDDPEKDVEIGTLKPEVDYQEVLNLIQSEMSLWLGSKGIKAAGIGNLTQENYASGISKIIDEADTYDVRQMQTLVFSEAEKALWDLILRYMHPVWVSQGLVENRAQFSPAAEVTIKFQVVPVGTQRSQLINDQKEEYAAGFTTRRRAISMLNPQMSMAEVDALIADIEDERSVSDGSEMAESEDRSTGASDEGTTGSSGGSDSREDSGEDGSR